MAYIIDIDDAYPKKCFGDELPENMSDLKFKKGRVGKSHETFQARFPRCLTRELERWDMLFHYSIVPLIVTDRFARILMSECDIETQVFDCEVHCKDGKSNKYKIIHIINFEECIDTKKSTMKSYPHDENMFYGVIDLVVKNDCVTKTKIARDATLPNRIFVTDSLAIKLSRAKLAGLKLERV